MLCEILGGLYEHCNFSGKMKWDVRELENSQNRRISMLCEILGEIFEQCNFSGKLKWDIRELENSQNRRISMLCEILGGIFFRAESNLNFFLLSKVLNGQFCYKAMLCEFLGLSNGSHI